MIPNTSPATERPIGKDLLLKMIARVPHVILAKHITAVINMEKKEKIMLSTLKEVDTMPFDNDAIAYFFISFIIVLYDTVNTVLSPLSLILGF